MLLIDNPETVSKLQIADADFAFKLNKNDREIVLEAVKQNGNALEYASETLKNDQVLLI